MKTLNHRVVSFRTELIKSDICNLIKFNPNARLVFGRYMPIYAMAKYDNDIQAQNSCRKAITGFIKLFFPPSLQNNLEFNEMLKNHINNIIDDQLALTPEYIKNEYKILIGRINTFLEMLNCFLQKIDLDLIHLNMRFDEQFQRHLIGFKTEVYNNINSFIKSFTGLEKIMHIDESYSENFIMNSIIQKNAFEFPRKARLLNNSDQLQVPLNCSSIKLENEKPSTEMICFNHCPYSTPSIIQMPLHQKSNDFAYDGSFQFNDAFAIIKSQPNQIRDEVNKEEEMSNECDNNSSFAFENSNETSNEQFSSDSDIEDPEYPFFRGFPEAYNDEEYAFDITQIMDCGTFTFHILSIGLTPTQAVRFLNHLGIKCYGLTTIYNSQNAISPIVIRAAEESMNYRKMNIPQGVGVTFDGAWSHQRKAYQHQAILIESNNNKIISSKVLFKDYKGHPGNYDTKKAGNLMEVAALKLMKEVLFDQRIEFFTSDGDVKIRNVIRNIKRETPLKMTRDPGHVNLSIMRTIKSLNTRNKNIFDPLLHSFEKFVKNIIFKIEDPDYRVNVYLNIVNHYSGEHDSKLCIHSSDSTSSQFFNSTNPNSKSIFKSFLEKTADLIHDVHISKTTQINESYNHHSKKFINKLYAFRGSYQIRSSISILDWNEKFFIFDILQKINSTQKPYLVFINSIKKELIEKKKAKARRATEHWKMLHKKEKLKKIKQAVSNSSSAHQEQTIIKEASQQPSSRSSQKNDFSDEESLSDEEESINEDEEYYVNTMSESTELSDDDSESDSSIFMLRYDALLEEDRCEFIRKNGIFLKHQLSVTCGLVRTIRNCYISAPLQLFARINPIFIKTKEYSDFFELMKQSENSIPIEANIIQELKEYQPNEENALLTVKFLIEKVLFEELYKNCYIKYFNSKTKEIETIDYHIISAIDTSLLCSNLIHSIDIFKLSLLSQIGAHNTHENIIEFLPPPVIFIELWKYNDHIIREYKFDDFIINVQDIDLQYECLGILIHTPDHFKAVTFDNERLILLDDELVADLSKPNENFNIYHQIELQDLQYHSIMVVYQAKND